MLKWVKSLFAKQAPVRNAEQDMQEWLKEARKYNEWLNNQRKQEADRLTVHVTFITHTPKEVKSGATELREWIDNCRKVDALLRNTRVGALRMA